MKRLSFANKTFDAVVCMEILEHIPDYLSAITEIFRVLKSGGTALMTFPWLGGQLYEHETRALVEDDGSITHLLAPQYHGDPAAPGEGIARVPGVGVIPWGPQPRLRRG
jgi:SAM-dependent methyltransferase